MYNDFKFCSNPDCKKQLQHSFELVPVVIDGVSHFLCQFCRPGSERWQRENPGYIHNSQTASMSHQTHQNEVSTVEVRTTEKAPIISIKRESHG